MRSIYRMLADIMHIAHRLRERDRWRCPS